MSVTDYTNMIANDMTSEVFKFLLHYEDKVGRGTSANLLGKFVEDLVRRVVFNTLNAYPSGEEEERAEKTVNHFRQMKTLLQDSIAQGFADGVAEFSGREMDYHCSIEPFPDPYSKFIN